MQQVNPGFVRPQEVPTFRIEVPESVSGNPEQRVRMYEQIAQRLEQLPGVVSVGLRPYEVVGVAGAERDDGLNQPETPIVYWPFLNDVYPTETVAYAVRSARPPAPSCAAEHCELCATESLARPTPVLGCLHQRRAFMRLRRRSLVKSASSIDRTARPEVCLSR